MAHKIAQPKKIQQKSRKHEVIDTNYSGYKVISCTSGRAYFVKVYSNGATCSCDWGHYRPRMDKRSGCSHVVAVFNHIEEGRTVSAWVNEDDAQRQHRPMTQIGDGVWLTSRKDAPKKSIDQMNQDLFG